MKVRQRIISVMAAVFEVDFSEIPENASPGVIEKWDSLRHMNLVLALEEEFNVRFNDNEFAELITVPLIELIISERSSLNDF